MKDILEIMELLPHRYPFLLVDKILEEDEDKIIGLKNVSINEPHFQGHFPGHPIMPGVLIVEGMAQCGGVLCFHKMGGSEGKVVYFTSIDKVKFRKPVRPGDQIRYEINIIRMRSNYAKLEGKATVDGEVCCSAEMSAAIVDK